MRRLTIDLAIFIALWVPLAFACAKPDRPDPVPKKKKAPQLPAIAGNSNWGVIAQDGRDISIRGNVAWESDGRILADNKTLVVVWTYLGDGQGRRAPGQYKIGDDGSIVGHWLWGESPGVEEQPDGTFKGLTNSEALRRPRE